MFFYGELSNFYRNIDGYLKDQDSGLGGTYGSTQTRNTNLKVLSSEMNPAEIRLILKNFCKGNVAVGF